MKGLNEFRIDDGLLKIHKECLVDFKVGTYDNEINPAPNPESFAFGRWYRSPNLKEIDK